MESSLAKRIDHLKNPTPHPKKKKKFSLLLLLYFNSSTLMLQISSYIFQITFSLKKIKKYIHFSVINDFIILFVLRHTCL